MKAISGFVPAVMTALALVFTGSEAFVHAQGPPPGRRLRLPPDTVAGVTPEEIQRMFEAVALVRSQEALKLSDEGYLPFLARYKALQEIRRRTLQERARMLGDLNRVVNEGAGDQVSIRERLKALVDLDTRSEGELHKAYEGLDAVLDVQQQARFRLFEERMERQKIELLMRARANRRLNRAR